VAVVAAERALKATIVAVLKNKKTCGFDLLWLALLLLMVSSSFLRMMPQITVYTLPL
jgi:hypothetical protein